MTPEFNNTDQSSGLHEHRTGTHTDTFSRMLTGLDQSEVERGVWHDDLLTLGGRLRSIFGNMVSLDDALPGYLIRGAGDLPVTVTCPLESTPADSVRMACPITSTLTETAGLWQFLLRENARLKFVRLSIDEGSLWADYQLPFRAACGQILETGVMAVAQVAQCLRTELLAAYRVA